MSDTEFRTGRRSFLALGGAALALGSAARTSPANAASNDGAAGAKKSGMRVRRLTWAGICVEVGETALFVDTILPDEKLGDPMDILKTTKKPSALVTHHHSDHFSNEANRAILGENGIFAAQADCLPVLDTRGLRVQSAAMWQPMFFPYWGGDIVAFPVPAVDGFSGPQSSWVIDGGGVRIFHGGDTQWHGHWVDYGRAYGPFDAAFLPINGARLNQGRIVDDEIPGVLTPEQAVIAAKRLGAKRLVPIHYGQPEPPSYLEIDHPLERLRAAAGSSLPLTVLERGEWLDIPSAR